MSSRSITGVLVACAVVAFAPVFPWLAAVSFDRVDDRWLDSLAGLGVSVPVALGLAALAFALHGIRLQQHMTDELVLDYDALAHETLRTAGMVTTATAASNGAPARTAATHEVGAATPVAAATPGGTMTVVAPDVAAPAGDPSKSKAGAAAGRLATRAGSRASLRAKSAAKQAFRERFRL